VLETRADVLVVEELIILPDLLLQGHFGLEHLERANES